MSLEAGRMRSLCSCSQVISLLSGDLRIVTLPQPSPRGFFGDEERPLSRPAERELLPAKRGALT